ncbi:MAG: hypothetical protein NUV86_12155 [Candidatus Scalindua sp.]|nr:hypothetical protein [Candidatus Scalindua sp.]
MKVTIEIPDSLPQEHVQQKIKEIEASLREEAKLFKTTKNVINEVHRSNDPWTNLDIELPTIDTQIEDLSINHDHYLYGTPKKS